MLRYLITDPKYYTSNIDTFIDVLQNSLTKHEIDMVCFRDKISQDINKYDLASKFVQTAKKFNIPQIVINSDISLAINVKATGVHLTSSQFNQISIAKQNNLFVIISCHSLEDILKAQKLNANMVTYSPIFDTPNKGKPKTIDNLNEILKLVSIPIIALGGIVSQEHINEIQQTKAIGFASIRYFI